MKYVTNLTTLNKLPTIMDYVFIITESYVRVVTNYCVVLFTDNKAVAVNATTTILYWNIGEHVNRDILGNKRAEYGKEVVKSLSRSLTEEYGKGWSEKQLRHCLRIAETFHH